MSSVPASKPNSSKPRQNLHVKVFRPDDTSETHDFLDWPLDVQVSQLESHIARDEKVPAGMITMYVEMKHCYSLRDYRVTRYGYEYPFHAMVEPMPQKQCQQGQPDQQDMNAQAPSS